MKKFNIKKIGSKWSNHTMVIGGMTLLLGIGAGVSFMDDKKKMSELPSAEPAAVFEEIRGTIEDAANEIPANVDGIDVVEF